MLVDNKLDLECSLFIHILDIQFFFIKFLLIMPNIKLYYDEYCLILFPPCMYLLHFILLNWPCMMLFVGVEYLSL